MSEEVLITVNQVGKKFCRNLKRSLFYGLQDIAADASGSSGSHARLRPQEFWANDNISFQLRRGECLGLIGRNGAGKTTLLKMLNGLIKPDKGAITIRGSVGALIALGAGFNPILTGRENIYVNGSILGLSRKHIFSKFDEIIEFADIGDFIDSPVQNYSSGMQVRLGFAVAVILLKPDVLLLDEVLAVGDAAFRNRCYNRIGGLLDDAAVIFVSHSLEQINRICNKGLVLRAGTTTFYGDIEEASAHYEAEVESDTPTQQEASFCKVFSPVKSARPALISQSRISHGDSLELKLEVEVDHHCVMQPRLQIYSRSGQIAAETGNEPQESVPRGKSTLFLRVPALHLNAGNYFISLLVYSSRYPETLAWSRNELMFEVKGHRHATTHYEIPMELATERGLNNPTLQTSNA